MYYDILYINDYIVHVTFTEHAQRLSVDVNYHYCIYINFCAVCRAQKQYGTFKRRFSSVYISAVLPPRHM